MVWVWVLLGMGFAVRSAGILPAAFPNGVAAGDVTGTQAVLWVRSTNLGPLTFIWSTNGLFQGGSGQRIVTVTNAMVPVKVVVDQLTPGQRYFYQATDTQGAAAGGTFRTPAADLAFHGLRFGVSGDWRGDLAPFPSIANAASAGLDFFVALGDTIYADVPSPALPMGPAHGIDEFRVKYTEVYGPRLGLNTLADLRASTATFAVMDDHEVVNNFAGGAAVDSDARFLGPEAFINETGFYRDGLQAFHEYHPIETLEYDAPADPRMHGKPKLYRTRTFGADAALFVLDARSFRDRPLAPVTNPFDTNAVAQFNARSFDRSPTDGSALPARTLLGGAQLAELKHDLRAAQEKGVLWKFIAIPEPIQNLGFADAADRFEGFARERADLLKFIAETPIQNVVFITADLHGTLVNNVQYRTAPEEVDHPTGAFEIITGSVAYDRPFGPTTFDYAESVQLAPGLNLLSALLRLQGLTGRAAFDALPRAEKDALFHSITDFQLNVIGLDSIGLEGSDIQATLQSGDYVAVHTFGWSEFEIDRETQRLTVTTYGIDPYGPTEVGPAILGRVPAVVSQFQVVPKRAPMTLEQSRRGDEIRLSWPTTSAGLVLQSTDRLESGRTWEDAEASPGVEGDRYVIAVELGVAPRFFRLRRR